jgi:hypothetical protein
MEVLQERTVKYYWHVPDTYCEEMRGADRASPHTRKEGRNEPTYCSQRTLRNSARASESFQCYAFAACIILAPLSITLYLVTWAGNQRAPLTPLVTSAMAGPTGNTLHFIGAIAASFFLPLGCTHGPRLPGL